MLQKNSIKKFNLIYFIINIYIRINTNINIYNNIIELYNSIKIFIKKKEYYKYFNLLNLEISEGISPFKEFVFKFLYFKY